MVTVYNKAAIDANLVTPSWVPGGHAYAVGALVINALGHVVRCVTAHTSGTDFTDDLPNWAPTMAPANEQSLTARSKASHGGVVGVGDKCVVALRFDDYQDAFRSTMLSLLTARGLPAGMACISRLSQQSWAAGTTGADIATLNKQGIEIWSHGTDHKDPSPHGLLGTNGLYEQIVTSRAEIEAWGVRCQGWMQPGATRLGTPIPYGTAFDTIASVDSYAGWLIRGTYGLSELYAYSPFRSIPSGVYHGHDHVTVSDGLTLTTMKARLDTAIALKSGIEFMCHTGNLGLAGMSTLADVTALLDYIITKWDAGLLEVVTPSGLMHADKSTNRLNHVIGGDFEGGATDWTKAPTSTYDTTAPHSGTQYLATPAAESGLTTPLRRPYDLIKKSQDGETYLFEGWARSQTSTLATSRFLVQSYPTATALNLSLTKAAIPQGPTWTKVRHAFTVPPGVDEITYAIGRNSGGGLDWDDISIKKV